jgi:hypothetical protein
LFLKPLLLYLIAVLKRGTQGQLRIFDRLSGLLQVIISQKKTGKAESRRFSLCWLGESIAGGADSLKPCPTERGTRRAWGLERICTAS